MTPFWTTLNDLQSDSPVANIFQVWFIDNTSAGIERRAVILRQMDILSNLSK